MFVLSRELHKRLPQHFINNSAYGQEGGVEGAQGTVLNGSLAGGEWIHVYVWVRPFIVHVKLPQHC